MTTHTPDNKGFTLVETLIAILILSMTIGALMTLAANGFFSVRYARNDIVASSLLQESLEFVRNSRDSAIGQGKTWEAWKDIYRDNGCFLDENGNGYGCTINTFALTPDQIAAPCTTGSCPYLNYYTDDSDQPLNIYGYSPSLFDPNATQPKIATTFIRTIKMTETDNGNQLVVTATMKWKNGTVNKTTAQSIILTNLFAE
jgi:type II secretory pathway pseudopilin PulG